MGRVAGEEGGDVGADRHGGSEGIGKIDSGFGPYLYETCQANDG